MQNLFWIYIYKHLSIIVLSSTLSVLTFWLIICVFIAIDPPVCYPVIEYLIMGDVLRRLSVPTVYTGKSDILQY